MSYRKLLERLEAADLSELDAIGLPDGSVDSYCQIEKKRNEYIQTREEAVDFIENNPEASLNLIPRRAEPGGKSVNMSIQTDALGAETTHYGFLDHRVLEELDFEIFSMGEPAEVTICEFEDGSLSTARLNEGMIKWSLEDLQPFPGTVQEKFSADLINCANHSNIHSMNQELEKIAELEPEAKVFNFDPGSLQTVRESKVRRMFGALSDIEDSCEVIVHANREELETVADTLDIEGSKGEKLQEVKEKTGISAYVLHGKDEAVAGTVQGVIEVENFEASRLRTRTGAGDRFDAAVGLGRAAGWSWEEALGLGNISAIHYLEENESGTPEQLRDKLMENIG